jgi:hypothetical protein
VLVIDSWDDTKMEWTGNCYVSFVVCGGPVAEPRKKDEADFRIRVVFSSLVTIPSHCHRFLSLCYSITTLVQPQVELQCYTSVTGS